jgi:hypothetical protein
MKASVDACPKGKVNRAESPVWSLSASPFDDRFTRNSCKASRRSAPLVRPFPQTRPEEIPDLRLRKDLDPYPATTLTPGLHRRLR